MTTPEPMPDHLSDDYTAWVASLPAPGTAGIDQAERVVETGAGLLDELHAALTRYVVLPTVEAADAVVLWIGATHALSCFEHATRLAIHSPVKRCGKSRLLEIVEATAYSAVPTTNISVPALFRMIEAASSPPTLVLDEADRLFGSTKKDEENRDLIAVLNNGFRDGKPTWRCVGPQQTPKPFSNYAMAAVAGIGRLPDTIEDRAVNVTMRRRMPGETVAKFRLRTDVPALHDLRDRLTEWAASESAALEKPVAGLPGELEDRAEDAWEPLVAVADAAGGSWPDRARRAALKLTREAAADDGEQSLETQLLGDVRRVLDGAAFIPTADLLAGLRALSESPWGDFDLTARKLALRVGKFGVKPAHNRAKTERGYHLHDLADAFCRYLPSDASDPSETTVDLHKRPDASQAPDGCDPSGNLNPSRHQRRSGAVLDTSDGWDGTPVPDREPSDGTACSTCGGDLDGAAVTVGASTCTDCEADELRGGSR